MLYKGVRVPVLGMVCMDMVMLDVSPVENPQCGDVVTIIGEDHGSHLSVMDVAGKIPNTLPHEVYNAIPCAFRAIIWMAVLLPISSSTKPYVHRFRQSNAAPGTAG